MTGEKDIGFGSSMLVVGANFSSSSMLFRENLTIRDDQFFGWSTSSWSTIKIKLWLGFRWKWK